MQPAVQALGAVQDAGVQAVTSDLCSQLAQLATTALYNGDANAARLIAAAFIQGEWQLQLGLGLSARGC